MFSLRAAALSSFVHRLTLTPVSWRSVHSCYSKAEFCRWYANSPEALARREARFVEVQQTAKKGDHETAVSLLQDLRRERLFPNKATYDSVIEICSNKGEHDLVIRLYDDFMLQGMQPDEITLQWVVKAYLTQRRFDELLVLYKYMDMLGIDGDTLLVQC